MNKNVVNDRSEESAAPMTAAQRKAARQRASKAAGVSAKARKVVADKPATADLSTEPGLAAGLPVQAIGPVEENLPVAEETTCNAETSAVISGPSAMVPQAAPISEPAAPAKAGRTKMVTFTLKGTNKRGTQAIYTGVADGENGGRVKTAVRFPLAAFVDKKAPETLVAEGPFAVRGKARSEMTPEERKAARAARPKLTLAEKAQKAEERAAKLRKQLESQAAAEPAGAASSM